MQASYNIGTEGKPQWVYVGTTGEPFLGQTPREFHAQKILSKKELMKEVHEISQRGSATKQNGVENNSKKAATADIHIASLLLAYLHTCILA